MNMAGYLFMCLFSVKIFPLWSPLPIRSIGYLLSTCVIACILKMLCHMYKKYFLQSVLVFLFVLFIGLF